MTYAEIHAKALELFRERTALQLSIREPQQRIRAIEREIQMLEQEREIAAEMEAK
jgi:hypothetical protein